jgi:hypothetical protein
MKRIILTITATSLAGIAAAQDETSDYDPSDSIVSEAPASDSYEPGQDIVTDESRKPNMSLGEHRQDSPLNTDYGPEVATDNSGDIVLAKSSGQSRAKSADLEGKKVVTLAGEEIGEIGAVGKSSAHEERVATIDVGDKTIAVPLSSLHRTPSDGNQVRISMLKTTIESEPAFDESTLTPEQ